MPIVVPLRQGRRDWPLPLHGRHAQERAPTGERRGEWNTEAGGAVGTEGEQRLSLTMIMMVSLLEMLR